MTEEVHAADASRVAALVAGNLDQVAHLLHDELVYVHSHGMVDGKATYVAALAEGTWSYDAIDHDITVDPVDRTTALAMGRMTARGTAYGRDVEVASLTVSVWTADADGHWRLRAFQSTKAPAPRGDR